MFNGSMVRKKIMKTHTGDIQISFWAGFVQNETHYQDLT